MNGRRRLRAIGALVATILLVVGVPVALIVFVGNPWPGRTTLELGDEVALVVGVLAVLAWLVWLRFVVAVVVEVRGQVAELRRPSRPARFAPPPPAPRGVGLLAQRLVAAALIVLPIAPRVTAAGAHGPDDMRRAPITLVSPAVLPTAPATPAAPIGGHVTVATGDTLFGLARTHLGDTERWREIFELNRDRPQSDGGRLTSPSIIRAGWTLALPVDATGFLEPETVTIEDGDNLWTLSHERLQRAGSSHDDGAVAGYVQAVVAANPDVVEDPDLIFSGEQFDFPAIGTPPPPPPPPEAPPPPPPPSTVVEAPADVTVPESERPVAPPLPAPAVPSSTTAPGPSPTAPPAGAPATADRGAPSPVGVGEAALLSAGVLALLASRRRARLRAARPRARVPEPPAASVAAERRLRTIDAGERLARVDVAIRAAAATLVDTTARIAIVRAAVDGVVELTLTGDAVLPPPWHGAGRTWCFPGQSPVELLADVARTVGAPCVALTQLGVDTGGGEVLADLEALGVLGVDAPAPLADAVVRGIAATLATSVFAEPASLVGVGIDTSTFLDHRRAHIVDTVDGALELAATLIGTTAMAPQSTFVLRARHTSGEAWEPAVVLVGSGAAGEIDADTVRAACRHRGGVAVVAAGDAPGVPWTLRVVDTRWLLEPSGVVLTPVGLSTGDVADLQDVLGEAAAPLVADDREPVGDVEVPWTLMVRLIGAVEVVDAEGRAVAFERSKALELIAWLALHRDRSTRVGAGRTALWELDVRDATFANVVSEARRSMARLHPPPDGEEWLGRTLTDVLPLHRLVISDVDIVRRRLDVARLQPPEQAIDTLRPAVELIRDMPFACTGYLWPDAEGITSNLVLLATSAATELAAHFLSMGDIDGVFWATGQGLKVLPGHEELIALRMRGHARAGDLSGVRQEWESYERVLDADPWSDGEPAPKLLVLRRQLLQS